MHLQKEKENIPLKVAELAQVTLLKNKVLIVL